MKGPVTRLSSSFVYNNANNASFLSWNLRQYVQTFKVFWKTRIAVRFTSSSSLSIRSFFCICFDIYTFFYVLNSLFKCLTPSGDGFHCLNKFHDTAPLTLFGRLGSWNDPYGTMLIHSSLDQFSFQFKLIIWWATTSAEIYLSMDILTNPDRVVHEQKR